jgi:nucleoside-diphosphate-sugar epimerase
MVRAVAAGWPLPFGAVRNRRSLIAVDNLTDLIRCAIDHPEAPGAPLLASDGEDLSTPELLRAIAASIGRPARLIDVPPRLLTGLATLAGRRPVMDRLTTSLQVDSTQTRQRLGWTPPRTVAAAFAKAGAAGW